MVTKLMISHPQQDASAKASATQSTRCSPKQCAQACAQKAGRCTACGRPHRSLCSLKGHSGQACERCSWSPESGCQAQECLCKGISMPPSAL